MGYVDATTVQEDLDILTALHTQTLSYRLLLAFFDFSACLSLFLPLEEKVC